jgi:hypothetical protein
MFEKKFHINRNVFNKWLHVSIKRRMTWNIITSWHLMNKIEITFFFKSSKQHGSICFLHGGWGSCKKYSTSVNSHHLYLFKISNKILKLGTPTLFCFLCYKINKFLVGECCNLAIYITIVCLCMLKLLTEWRSRTIWNVICKWQCMPLLPILQWLNLNSIDYSFAKMMIRLKIRKFSQLFPFFMLS